MSAIPNWLVGRNVTSISITPQTVGATTGTLTAGTLVTLAGLLDEISLEQTNETENIAPLDVRQNNEVITGSGTSLTLTEILSANTGTTYNVLSQAAQSTDIAVVTFTRQGKVWTITGVIGSYSERIVRGKSVGTCNLKPTGIGATLA